MMNFKWFKPYKFVDVERGDNSWPMDALVMLYKRPYTQQLVGYNGKSKPPTVRVVQYSYRLLIDAWFLKFKLEWIGKNAAAQVQEKG